MSDIIFKCPECFHGLAVEAAAIGTVITCTSCRRRIVVPVPSRTADTLSCPQCQSPRTRAAVYCRYCGCEFNMTQRSLLEGYFRRARAYRSRSRSHFEAMQAMERRYRIAATIGLPLLIIVMAYGVQKGSDLRKRDLSFSTAIELARPGRPTDQAINALMAVIEKYPEAEQTPTAKESLRTLARAKERQRAAVETAIQTSKTTDFGSSADALSYLSMVRKENPDAPNLGKIVQIEDEFRKSIAEAKAEEQKKRHKEATKSQSAVRQQHQQDDSERSSYTEYYQDYATKLRSIIRDEAKAKLLLETQQSVMKLLMAKAELANQNWQPNEMGRYIQQAHEADQVARRYLDQYNLCIATRIKFIKIDGGTYLAVLPGLANDSTLSQYERDYCHSLLLAR